MKLEELTKHGKVTFVIGTAGIIVYAGLRTYLKYLEENDYKDFQNYGKKNRSLDMYKVREKGLI